MSDFFNRLDLLRKKRGEALTDIASFLGISGPAVHCWKKGGLPKPDKLRLLSEHYGTSVEWLLSGRGAMLVEATQQSPSACQHCVVLQKRIEELETKLSTAYETINNQSKALAQGLATEQRGPPAAPTAHAGGLKRHASTSEERRAGA